MPRASSVGWLGWMRTERRPGRPIVFRKRVTTRHLRADEDQVLVAHQLGHGRRHLRRQARRHGGERAGVRRIGEQPVAEIADGQVGDRRESARVVRVDDEARDLVLLVGHDRFVEKALERQLGKRHPRRHALLGRGGGDAGEHVARAQRRRLGEQVLQVREAVDGLPSVYA